MLSLKEIVDLYEKALIKDALRKFNFNARDAANAMGTDYQTFRNKMVKHELTRKQLRQSRLEDRSGTRSAD